MKFRSQNKIAISVFRKLKYALDIVMPGRGLDTPGQTGGNPNQIFLLHNGCMFKVWFYQ
jgi:hypothetical protein